MTDRELVCRRIVCLSCAVVEIPLMWHGWQCRTIFCQELLPIKHEQDVLVQRWWLLVVKDPLSSRPHKGGRTVSFLLTPSARLIVSYVSCLIHGIVYMAGRELLVSVCVTDMAEYCVTRWNGASRDRWRNVRLSRHIFVMKFLSIRNRTPQSVVFATQQQWSRRAGDSGLEAAVLGLWRKSSGPWCWPWIHHVSMGTGTTTS